MITRRRNLGQQIMSMVMISYFLLLAFFNFAVTSADDPVYVSHNCTTSRNFTSNSAYQFNLDNLFLSLSSPATGTTSFPNTTEGGYNTDDTAYGLSMCRRDLPSQLCHDCVALATRRIKAECQYNKEAIIWYEECVVRYSDHSFFSTLQTSPESGIVEFYTLNGGFKLSNKERRVLENTLNDVAAEAAKSGPAKFATKEVNVSAAETLYSLAQCTPDLSTKDCDKCFRDIIGFMWSHEVFSDGMAGEFFYPSCNLRFSRYRFYYKDNAEPQASLFGPKAPATPEYLNHSCPSDKTFTVNSAYRLNLRNLLSSLVLFSNTAGNIGFYNTTVASRDLLDTVYGLFMCRGDVSPQLCHQCVGKASQRLLSSDSKCQFSKEAIIWYDVCLLRYSNHSFFSTLDTRPKYIDNSTDIIKNQQDDTSMLLASTLKKVVAEATKSGLPVTGAKKFATEETYSDAGWETLYTLAQCTPDLSTQDCRKCLNNIVEEITLCCLGKREGTVMYPSCNLRFQSNQFYDNKSTVAEAPAPPPTLMVSISSTTGNVNGQSRTIITVVVVILIVVSVILFCFAYYILRRKRSKNYKAILKENFGSESTTLESPQFSLATIEAATNKFSQENRIGKGGFGEVYKGVLSDSREIAVKRLSRSSGQGVVEFKNEILLIAKLQHRNLVALLGFCLEGREKILVYEFVPNRSLDYFLFGSQRKRVLNWSERYKIIGGIARGILYLHEYSRLKVIHRDLKPSNILLDDDMNPKISNFGMAKMVTISETEGSTNRIVGTYGKRNANCHDSQYVDGLLSYAWKQWRGEKWSEILDSNLIELESYAEVIKCIQVGLLCVQENPDARPSMVTVVQYLSNDSIQLPFPQEPAFFLHGRMEPTIAGMEFRFGQHASDSKPCSINEMSLSKFFPR